MNYARDLHSGKIVAAKDALGFRYYTCPRPGCGGRVYLPHVLHQRPHFRHYPGEGTAACDEYYPGDGSTGPTRRICAVEENPAELGLLLTHVDVRWGLGLRLPEIPSDELGDTSLGALRSALVDVFAGRDYLQRVSALDLRPGVGVARTDVLPSLQTFRTEPTGLWPVTIDKKRWLLESRGLDATGVLFRFRRGEWMRLRAGSGVQHDEHLLVLADARCAPPSPILVSAPYILSRSGSLQWNVWEVRLPSKPLDIVTRWLVRLGHEVVPRLWSIRLATPPRAYSEGDEPLFWVGDSPVLILEAPQPTAINTVAFESSSNSHSASVRSGQDRFAYVSVNVRDAGHTRLAVADERSVSFDLAFVQRPPLSKLPELLARLPRLRIQVGQQKLEAWQSASHRINIPSRDQLEVLVDLGDDSVRALVTVWVRGKQHFKRGLDSRGVARAIENALAEAERVEVDAENLGRIVIMPVRTTMGATHTEKVSDRLAWRDQVMSMCSRDEERPTSTLLKQPRVAESLAVRQVSPAALVRSRMALRRRHETGGIR